MVQHSSFKIYAREVYGIVFLERRVIDDAKEIVEFYISALA
jgi:hypothetical protein